MIRQCNETDFETIYEIINDAAQVYRDVIPHDRWQEPYMSRDALKHEVRDGVIFWSAVKSGQLNAVMGIQDKGEVTLIRHAYVRSAVQNQGLGTLLLRHIERVSDKPVLIGTWAAAAWAISFYQRNGYQLVSAEQKDSLLKRYWRIPDRQVETSVVLADERWINRST